MTKLPETRKTVRIWITHAFVGYVIVGSIFLITLLCFSIPLEIPGQRLDAAESIFLAILPLAGSVIGYWFGQNHANKSDD